MHTIMEKTEWTETTPAIHHAFAVPNGVYTSATGERYEVTAYHPKGDLHTVVRLKTGRTVNLPRPLVRDLLMPVRIESDRDQGRAGDIIMVCLVLGMAAILAVTWGVL